MQKHRFPNETEEYRAARDELLKAEIGLRAQIEEVAALRRKLPMGGVPPQDYVFDEMTPDGPWQVKLSELFVPGKDSLIIYSYMHSPQMKSPCVMCTSLIDGFNGSAPHIVDRVNFVVVGKSPIEKLHSTAQERGWNNIRLLSSAGNSYNADYYGEDAEGRQWPACNVFVKTADGVRHFYATELIFVDMGGGHTRHVDLVWPIWNFFDMTPEGRGTDWYPKLSY